MEVMLLGHPKSSTTRKAQRFFKERRVPFHDRDLRKRAPSPGELRRWVDALGVEAVTDTSSKRYVDDGLAYLSADAEDWIERLVGDPELLRLPLVRFGSVLTVGDDQEGWAAVVEAYRDEAG